MILMHGHHDNMFGIFSSCDSREFADVLFYDRIGMTLDGKLT